jgi:hypothetical protein
MIAIRVVRLFQVTRMCFHQSGASSFAPPVTRIGNLHNAAAPISPLELWACDLTCLTRSPWYSRQAFEPGALAAKLDVGFFRLG